MLLQLNLFFISYNEKLRIIEKIYETKKCEKKVLIRTLVLVNLIEDVYSTIGSLHGENIHTVSIKYENNVYWCFFSFKKKQNRMVVLSCINVMHDCFLH